jgi:Tol biopolymer transport system component
MISVLLAVGLPPVREAFQRVVFSGTHAGRQHLYAVNLDGTNLRRITVSPKEDIDPVWSRDGRTILFTRVSNQGNARFSYGHLWAVRSDGSQLRQLTAGRVFDGFERWTSGGSAVLFYRQGDRRGYYRFDLGSKKLSQVRKDAVRHIPSPDGGWLAYPRFYTHREHSNPSDLWLTSSPSQKGRRLTNLRAMMYDPVWSSDGRHIAFVVEKGAKMGLYVIDIPGGAVRNIVQDASLIDSPAWSPDGKRLAFVQAKAGNPMTNASFRRLYVVQANGSGMRRLTDSWGDDFAPQWTKDGRAIVIQGQRGMVHGKDGVSGAGKSCIVIVDADGGGERILRTDVPAYDVALSPK